jgi:hypothetical protein
MSEDATERIEAISGPDQNWRRTWEEREDDADVA